MRVPDFILIPVLIGSELWRRGSRRIRSGPLYQFRFSGSTPSGLTMAPKDIRPADAARAVEIYSGHYTFGEDSVSTKGESPFLANPPSQEWFSRLHTFRWLRHLQESGTELSQANAQALVNDWIDIWGSRLNTQAWRSDIVASRLIAWFCHSPLLLKNTSLEDFKPVLKSLARQSRYLHHNLPHMRDGYPRLQAAIALAFSSLCLAGREKTIKSALRDLERELSRQVLPDGTHISRNPVVLLEILADLLSLKETYKTQGHGPSTEIITAIDKMMGALRFFRHSNGDLAQFNGTGFTHVPLLTTILRYDTSQGGTLQSASHSGYERLQAGNTVLLMDCGKPLSRATARRAMAGTLSFELSSGSNQFIVNCGVPESGFLHYAPFVRATAAHSTATLNDTSSSRFADDSKLHQLLPSPLIRTPETIQTKRLDNAGAQIIQASHDGYEPHFGITHKREIELSHDGNLIHGCDTFIASHRSAPQKNRAAIRFHLPPTISASHLSNGQSVLMAAQNNDAWTFTCIDCPISLEESIRFSGPGLPRKSEQIVLNINCSEINTVRWVLERRKKKPPSRSRKKSSSAKSSPDLLDVLEDQDTEH